MTEKRRKFFEAMTEEEIRNLTHEDFTVSELNEIIEETPMSRLDRKIARCRYADRMTIDEISESAMVERKTVIKRLSKINPMMTRTVMKIV